MHPMRIILFALAVLLMAEGAGAQLVRGTVTDATTLAPVAGAFVSLVDDEGRARVGVLADVQGGYALRAPAAGSYRLRVERIGYEAEESAPFRVDAQRATTVPMALRSRAIELDALLAEGENRCRIGPQLGARTAAVWEEARKALRVANWTAEQSGRTFRTLLYTHTYEPAEMRRLGESYRTHDAVGARAFTTPPVTELIEHGYVREYADSIIFYAPDADVLLSDGFADTHCFRLQHEGARVGLRFEPLERSSGSDVEGTLWLDARTLALQELSFTYDRLPYREHDGVGGRIQFAMLDDGAVIVDEWYIRSPNWARIDSRVQVAELREHGGRVIDAFDARERSALPATAALGGSVHDSVAGRPLRDAVVVLPGTSAAARTDEHGRFLLTDLVPGTYAVEIDHPRLDSLPRIFAPPIVTLVQDDTVQITAATPSVASLRASLCWLSAMPRELRANRGIVWGRAHDGADRAYAGESVSVRWTSRAMDGRRIRSRGSVSTVTTPSGRYVACGVPDEARGDVVMDVADRSTEQRELELGSDGVARIDFIVPAPGHP